MSKIGRLPVEIKENVTVQVENEKIEVTGPKGNLSFHFRPEVTVEVNGGIVKVGRKSETKIAKSLHGLTRSIISNMVKGVSEGHEKTLEIVGVGYRAAMQGQGLTLNVGYSHPVSIDPVPGIQMDIRDNKITISGADKVLVGEVAAKIRRIRPPEPYKGKGIRYFGEVVRRKIGKAAKAAGGGS